MTHATEAQKTAATAWFTKLRDDLCSVFEAIEDAATASRPAGRFVRTSWERDPATGAGGGEMSLLRGGRVFEKVGVNISAVWGDFSHEFRGQIPGTKESPTFWASGVSLVAHMQSPLVPAAHFNTRMISTGITWFGGGGDLNPMYPVQQDTADFHAAFKAACDKHDPNYYPRFKQWCDEYFFIKHRGVSRGVGGIFYDNLTTTWENDFAFTQDVGRAFLESYPALIRRHVHEAWTPEQRAWQLQKRGLYAEFNLLYDRGTQFGLKTGGNVEAILLSLPPEATWP
jgi:coproporphyrinogen III oxidase